jgi:cytochrome c
MADLIGFLYKNQLEDSPGNAGKGEKIIFNKGCLSCHSFNGKGKGISSDLAKLTDLDSPLKMITSMFNHAAKMQKEHLEKDLDWPKFSGKDMADLYAYLTQLTLTGKIMQ